MKMDRFSTFSNIMNQDSQEELESEHYKLFEELELEELDAEEINFTIHIIRNYSYLFTQDCFTPLMEHQIQTKTQKILKKPYRKITTYTAQQQADILSQINALLATKSIIASDSKYNNEIVVKRQNSTFINEPQWQLSTPFNCLNRRIVPQVPGFKKLSVVRKIINKNLYFSILGLENLYNRILINEEDGKKTAFTTPVGKYQLKSLIPSIKGSENTFLKLLQRIFPRGEENNLIFLRFGMIIASPTLDEHKTTLTNVFHTLHYYVIPIDSTKMKFFRSIVDTHEYVNKSMSAREIPKLPNYTGKLLTQLAIDENGFTTTLSEYGDNPLATISNSSRPFCGPEKLYDNHEKLTLAIIHSIRRYKGFIVDNPIYFYDGRKDLEWIDTISKGFKNAHWLLEVENFNWNYIPYEKRNLDASPSYLFKT